MSLNILGILCYEIFHKKAPFKGRRVEDVKKKLTKNVIEFKTELKKEWKNIIKAMLQIDPRKRPTAKQLLNLDFVKNIKNNKSQNVKKEEVENTNNSKEHNIWGDESKNINTENIQKFVKKFSKHSGSSFCGKYKYNVYGMPKQVNIADRFEQDTEFFNTNTSQISEIKRSNTFCVANPFYYEQEIDDKSKI